MRITIVGNFGLGYKGTMSARAVPIGRELAKLGHQVTLLVPAENASSATDPTIGEIRLIEVRSMGTEVTSRRGLGSAMAHLVRGLELSRIALRDQPDILYAFKPKAYAGLALLLFWLLRTIGLSRSRLVLDLDDWEGKGGWVDREPGARWQDELISWHERWCIDHADLITAASRELVALARRESRPIVYLPNAASKTSPGWVLGDRQVGRKFLGVDDRPVVLAYTRFLEFAPSRLLDVFSAILLRIPTARLVVVGKGLHGEEDEFGADADRRGLSDRIVSLGWTDPRDLPNIFAAADVALYLLDDNLLNRAKCPMKLVDLLLAGTAVVADQVGQASEYIEDGSTGLLVSTGDTGEMAGAAIELMADSGYRMRLGRAARSNVLERWNWACQTLALDRAIRLL